MGWNTARASNAVAIQTVVKQLTPSQGATFDLGDYLQDDDYAAIIANDIDGQDLEAVETAYRAWTDAAVAALQAGDTVSRVRLVSPAGTVACRDEILSDASLVILRSALGASKVLDLSGISNTIWKCQSWRAHDPDGDGARACRTMPTGAWLAGQSVPAVVWRFEGPDSGNGVNGVLGVFNVVGQRQAGGAYEPVTGAWATDPIGVHIMGQANWKGDGFQISSLGTTGLLINSLYNTVFGRTEINAGIQPVNGGSVNGGRAGQPANNVHFDYTDNGDGTGTLTAKTQDTNTAIPGWFVSAHEGETFYLSAGLDTGTFSNGPLALELDTVTGDGSTCTTNTLGTTLTAGRTTTAKKGSFGVLTGSISAEGNVVTLDWPIDFSADGDGVIANEPNLVGRYVYIPDAGNFDGDSYGQKSGMLTARITASSWDGTTQTLTLSQEARYAVTSGPILFNPSLYVGHNDDGPTDFYVNNTGIFRSRVETFSNWNAVPAIYQHCLTHREYDTKWHGIGMEESTFGTGFNFAGQHYVAVIDSCELYIAGLLIQKGYGYDAPKLYCLGQTGNHVFDGVKADGITGPQKCAIIGVSPRSSSYTDSFNIRINGYAYTDNDLRYEMTTTQVGSHGDATRVRGVLEWVGPTEIAEGDRLFNRFGDITADVINSLGGYQLGDVVVIDISGGISPAGYTDAQLNNIAHSVNTTNKRQGRTVYNTSQTRLVTTNGSAASAVWRFADGTTANTPV